MKNEKKHSIEISKDFPVSVDQLYKAWISPDALKKWWTPMDKKLTDVQNDVKKGGSIKYTANDSEPSLVITGEYEEVKEKEKLVYTWDFNFSEDAFEESPFRLSINFTKDGNSSSLEVHQENLKDNEAVQVHKKGWEKQLDNLKKYLEEKDS